VQTASQGVLVANLGLRPKVQLCQKKKQLHKKRVETEGVYIYFSSDFHFFKETPSLFLLPLTLCTLSSLLGFRPPKREAGGGATVFSGDLNGKTTKS
jgi:hypothetical protein